uniref:Uncharacterized protein n=1 Tax=Glossina pallidipes TaxID=7398 RepID=A0A1B0A9F4_GLOPL
MYMLKILLVHSSVSEYACVRVFMDVISYGYTCMQGHGLFCFFWNIRCNVWNDWLELYDHNGIMARFMFISQQQQEQQQHISLYINHITHCHSLPFEKWTENLDLDEESPIFIINAALPPVVKPSVNFQIPGTNLGALRIHLKLH